MECKWKGIEEIEDKLIVKWNKPTTRSGNIQTYQQHQNPKPDHSTAYSAYN